MHPLDSSFAPSGGDIGISEVALDRRTQPAGDYLRLCAGQRLELDHITQHRDTDERACGEGRAQLRLIDLDCPGNAAENPPRDELAQEGDRVLTGDYRPDQSQERASGG